MSYSTKRPKDERSYRQVLRIQHFCLDPELMFQTRIQQKMKEQLSLNFISPFRPVNSRRNLGLKLEIEMAES